MNGVLLMSEIVSQTAEEQMAVPKPMSAGEMLRKAREAAGLHIAALAVSMKVPVKKLEALEADRLDLLHDVVFVRALASSVCRALKIDAAPVLDKLPQTTAPRLKPDELGINTPFRAPGEGASLSVWDQLSKPVVLAALALLVGALVLIFFPSMEQTEVVSERPSEPASAPVPVVAVASAVPEQVAPVPATVTVSPLPADAGKPSLPVAAAARIPPMVAVASQTPASAAALPAVAANARALTPVPGTGTTSGVVVLKTRASSWVEVTDANGVVQLRRTMQAGETVGASGALPLSVTVGRADATDVQVRGKPFDLAPLAKDNVARFEVK